MLSVLPPYDLTESKGEGAIWGDIDVFMCNVWSGYEALEYDRLCAEKLSISDQEIRSMMGASVTLPGCI